MKKRMKEIRAFVIGALVMAVLLSAGVAIARTVTIEVIYGIRVSLDGRMIQFAEDSQPFVTSGRTFLPVRALADTLGLGVDFDPATNTVLLTSEGQPAPTPTPQPPAPTTGIVGFDTLQPFNVHNSGVGANIHNVATGLPDSFMVRGIAVPSTLNALRAADREARFQPHSSSFAEFELGGNFARLTAIAAVADGGSSSPGNGIWLQFHGDGNFLGEYNLTVGNPADVDILLTGVNTLRISFTNRAGSRFYFFPAVYNAQFHPAGSGAVTAQPGIGFDTLQPFNVYNGILERTNVATGLPDGFRVRGELIPSTRNALRGSDRNAEFWGGYSRIGMFADFNLNGDFTRFTATAAVEDGSDTTRGRGIRVSFLGDGNLLGEYVLTVGNPVDIDINLSGVNTLRIGFNISHMYSSGEFWPAIYNAQFHMR